MNPDIIYAVDTSLFENVVDSLLMREKCDSIGPVDDTHRHILMLIARKTNMR
jgi:hypothetical protein